MANLIFLADNTIPGQSVADFARRAADGIQTTLTAFVQEPTARRRHSAMRRSLRGLDRHLLQDLGLDRNAC